MPGPTAGLVGVYVETFGSPWRQLLRPDIVEAIGGTASVVGI